MADSWSPPLHLAEVRGGCRLSLAGCAHGWGETLQEAADDLVRRLLCYAERVRAGAVFPPTTDLPPIDGRLLAFLHDLGRIAEEGGDVRQRLFGSGSAPASA